MPLVVLGLLLGWLLLRGRGQPLEALRRELAAIDAGRAAREIETRLGLKRAKAAIERKHAKALADLDTKQAAEAAQLRNDPAALARYLMRVSR